MSNLINNTIMEEEKKSVVEKLKVIGKKVGIITTLSVTVFGAFSLGYIYSRSTTKIKPIVVNHIDNSDVNLALDQNNHLMVIDKKTGNYTIYDDSVGVTIFNIYARNLSH